MLDTTAARAARRAIVAAGVAGLDQPDLLRRTSTVLRDAVPFDAAGWVVTDPATLLPLGGISDRMPVEACSAYFDNELLQPDVNKFVDLVHRPQAAGVLSTATGGEPERSRRYRTMMRPFGHERELRFALTVDGAAWGTACLVRGADAPEFSANEVAYVTAIGRHVAQGLRSACAVSAAATAAPDGPGMLVVSDDLTISSATAAGEAWLERLDATWGRLDGHLPTAVRSVVCRARACAYGGGADGPPHARVRTRDGLWMSVHASALSGMPQQWAVMLEPSRPAEVLPLAAQAAGLTPREQEVLGMLLRGFPDKEVARRLVVSDHTAREHAKRVLQKLGVRSRNELAAHVFADHFTPWWASTEDPPTAG